MKRWTRTSVAATKLRDPESPFKGQFKFWKLRIESEADFTGQTVVIGETLNDLEADATPIQTTNARTIPASQPLIPMNDGNPRYQLNRTPRTHHKNLYWKKKKAEKI